jgi:hypothetical protein
VTSTDGYLNRREALSSALAIGCTASGLFGSTVLSATGMESMIDSVNPRLFSFVGGATGPWRVTSSKAIVGEPMPEVSNLQIVNVDVPIASSNQWVLRGITSNERYATREEKNLLLQKQAPIGRPAASLSALIPIRKNAKWWALTQDERRAIFEERSHHVSIGLKYLPAIARRLHHCRDLAETEPFDFLTLFDYDNSNEAAFDDMLAELRATEEWKFIDREVDIRLVKA